MRSLDRCAYQSIPKEKKETSDTDWSNGNLDDKSSNPLLSNYFHQIIFTWNRFKSNQVSNRDSIFSLRGNIELSVKQECIPVGCVPPTAVSVRGWPSVMAFCCGLLLCPSVMAFWFGGLLNAGSLLVWCLLVWCLLVWWPSGVVAFCYGLLVERVGTPPPPENHTRTAFNQKATKPEGHNRRPHPP